LEENSKNRQVYFVFLPACITFSTKSVMKKLPTGIQSFSKLRKDDYRRLPGVAFTGEEVACRMEPLNASCNFPVYPA
jgi:hypothetical protein